jgi:hypothetical protein
LPFTATFMQAQKATKQKQQQQGENATGSVYGGVKAGVPLLERLHDPEGEHHHKVIGSIEYEAKDRASVEECVILDSVFTDVVSW